MVELQPVFCLLLAVIYLDFPYRDKMRKEVMVMQLEQYEKAEMEIIEFDVMDIMTDSRFGYEEEEGEAQW